MTSVDPSHIPTKHHRQSRGQAVNYDIHSKRGTVIPIPDLRFEQSYLRSLRRGVHLEDSRSAFVSDGKENDNGSKSNSELYGVPLVIDWKHVFYITFRDQLLSPFLQGAALALAAFYVRPFLRVLGARIRTHVSSTWATMFTPRAPEDRSWMRRQAADLSTHGVSTNIALAR